jgi:hypothetical protein
MSDNSDDATSHGAPLDPEEKRRQYNRAVREARLVTILLSSFSFKVDRAMMQPPMSDWKPSFDGELEMFDFDKATNTLASRVLWNVEIKIKRKNYVKCAAQYDVVYDGFSSLNNEIARLIAENLARPATYAYFRALFASVDWAADIGVPPLPIMKFHPKV